MDIAVTSTRIIISQKSKTLFIPLNKISYIERLNQCSYIITQNDLIPVRISLKSLEEILPNDFIRSHRSFIINKSSLKELSKQDNNNYEAEFYNTKTKALVSKVYFEHIFT